MAPVLPFVFRLLKLLGIVFLSLQLTRIGFVMVHFNALNKPTFLQILSILFQGSRFDVAVICIVNSVFILLYFLPFKTLKNSFAIALNVWFIATNGLCFLLNCIDIAYYPFVQKRMQADVFKFINGDKGTDFYSLLPNFLKDFWYIWILFFVLLIAFYKVCKSVLKQRQGLLFNFNLSNISKYVVVLCLAIGLSIIGIRGGLQLKPITILNAATNGNTSYTNAILNSPFTLIQTIGKNGLTPKLYFDNKELNANLLPFNTYKTNAFKGKNVVLIIVESLSTKLLSKYNKQAKTPFLDSLLQNNYACTNAFANARESVQGIPAICASIPSWMDEPYIFSPYATNSLSSLPNLLKPLGYKTLFFHGGKNGTMGFDIFAKQAGFESYFGKNEFNNNAQYDGSWGIWDHAFLNFMGNKIAKEKSPFLSVIFTLNTHHPFTIPTTYKNKFKTNHHPMHACMEYLDFALKQWFLNAQKQTWFKNTLFIITGDHAAPSGIIDNADKLDNYRIPIIMIDGAGVLKGENQNIVNQIDILPSILDNIGYTTSFFSFGKSVFKSNDKSTALFYANGLYNLVTNQYVCQFDGKKLTSIFDYKIDANWETNLIENPAVYGKLNDFEREVKQKIQIYTTNLINNSMGNTK